VEDAEKEVVDAVEALGAAERLSGVEVLLLVLVVVLAAWRERLRGDSRERL
jgi:hypothetical protein